MTDTACETFVSVLMVGEYKNDRLLLHEISSRSGWRLYEAGNRRGAIACLAHNPVHVVIAESDLKSWNWRTALRDLQRLDHPPQLIVTSQAADESLWAEVLNIGGYDVLPQPLERDEVERVIASARRHFGGPSEAGAA
jgi:DNA-binding response OmpR family regulator